MFAKSLCVLLAAGVVAVSGSFRGVNPNTLSCDPHGHVHLLLPHHTECNLFYMCVHGQEVERQCSGNTIFDFELQVCNWDWATKCWLRELEEDIEGSGSGDDAIWDLVESESYDAADAEAAPAPVAAVQPAPAVPQPTINCRRAIFASVQLPYNGNCQRFWRCNHGRAESAYCAEGLYFNAQTQMCDLEVNVKCESSVDDELQGEFIVYK